ncbi:MAG: hypothetical protein IIU42_02000, partial [Ruminococcus sp.]|nr:hypothetical protein [Ruminococcus sp.]
GMGESVTQEFIRKQIDIAHESISKEIEFKVKFANLKQNLSVAWLRAEDTEKATPIRGSLKAYAPRTGVYPVTPSIYTLMKVILC